MDWNYLVWNRKMSQAVVNTVPNNLLPRNAENVLNSSRTMGFSRRTLLHAV